MFIVNFYKSLEPINQSAFMMVVMACLLITVGLVAGKFSSDEPVEKSNSKATLL